MSLDVWLKNHWLRAHAPTPREIADLLAVADRDLRDSTSGTLSDDWRFGIAYNASLQLAHAALLAAGYEPPKGESHHFRVIQSLEHTIGADAKTVRQLDAFRKKRNAGVYERTGTVSTHEADEMVALARSLRTRVEAWGKAAHPNLFP